VPITIANLAVVRNETDAIAFVAPRKIAGDGEPPESVQFLGRSVYAGLVVVLVTVMIHGLKPGRVRRIREALQIDSRTVKVPMVAG